MPIVVTAIRPTAAPGIGSVISAYFIIAANSWMQHPVGVTLTEDGRPRQVDFFAVLTNNTALAAFSHAIVAALMVAGALLAFALSFDEIAVTFFLAGADTTTLPLWVLGSLRQTQSLPEVNAVARVILLISLPLIAIFSVS